MNLTPEFSIVDYQATPSGYYQIAFRSADEFVTVTQLGRGGCNQYSSRSDAFNKWLDDNANLAVTAFREMGMPALAQNVADRDIEWEDSVILTIADLIEMRILTVTG